VKYLAWLADAERVAPLLDDCAFQDMRDHAWHIDFLRALAPWADLTTADYAAHVLRPATRAWWGGGVRFEPTRLHPTTGDPGVLLWTVYSQETGGVGLTPGELLAADAALAPCLPGFTSARAYYPHTAAQRAMAAQHQAALNDAGLAIAWD
jgi:hypothetical protein